jgi:hypothetical protein
VEKVALSLRGDHQLAQVDKNQARAAVKRAAKEEWDMLMLASSSSSPRHRGSIERGVDGGDHRFRLRVR